MQIVENKLDRPVADCEYLQQVRDEIESDQPAVSEIITYHDCHLIAATGKCPYPARYCEFKKETEELIDWIQATVRGGA